MRGDRQLTNMAGEFLAAGKLFKRGYQVAVTMGNAKAIDLFAHNPKTHRSFTVQVKALERKNCFPIHREDVQQDHVYIFIILNPKPDSPVEDYFILWGRTIIEDINRFFGSSYRKELPCSMPGINYGPLKDFKDNWGLFDEQ